MMRRLTRGALVAVIAGAPLAALAVSCAVNDGNPGNVTGDTPNLLDGGAPDTSPATDSAPPPDAGCDSADPSCTTKVVSCADVAWCIVPTPVSPFYALKAVWGTSKDDVWAVGSGGTIVHYDGSTWSASTSGLTNTFNAVWASGPDDVYVVSTNTVLLHGTGVHGGPASAATWTPMPAPIAFGAALINAVWGSSASDVRIAGTSYSYSDPDTFESRSGNQFIATTGDGGAKSWAPVTGAGTVHDIWGSSASDLWMLVDNSSTKPWQTSLTLHGTAGDGGALTYREVDSQSSDILESVHGSSSSDVWAVGSGGAIRHIKPSEARWQVVPSPTKARLHAVFASGPDDVWAVGDSGTILHYDGKRFTASTAQFPIGKKPALYGIWGSGPSDVWIVGDAVALHYTGPKTPGGGQ
jgi:hypothetical protein